MENTPMILHIDLGNQSLTNWLRDNKYVIYSELIRYIKKMVDDSLDSIQAIMISNLSDNIVFVVKRESMDVTLGKAMEYFLDREEFEKCAEIRDLEILIENKKNERTNTTNGGGDKRKPKSD